MESHAIRSRYAACAPTKSVRASPPNFSRAARASSQRDSRLGDDGERLDRLDVAPLDERRSGLAGREVDGAERLHERRQRLHRGADDDGRAVGHAAFEAACAVGRASAIRLDLVVRLRAAHAGEREAVSDLDALDRLNAHERCRRAARRDDPPSPRRSRDPAARRLRRPRRRRPVCPGRHARHPLHPSTRLRSRRRRSPRRDPRRRCRSRPGAPLRRRRRRRERPSAARSPARARCGRRRART